MISVDGAVIFQIQVHGIGKGVPFQLIYHKVCGVCSPCCCRNIRIKIHAIRNSESFTLGNIVFKPIIHMAVVVSMPTHTDNCIFNAVCFHFIPVNFFLVFTDINPLQLCPRNRISIGVNISAIYLFPGIGNCTC